MWIDPAVRQALERLRGHHDQDGTDCGVSKQFDTLAQRVLAELGGAPSEEALQVAHFMLADLFSHFRRLPAAKGHLTCLMRSCQPHWDRLALLAVVHHPPSLVPFRQRQRGGGSLSPDVRLGELE